LKTTSFRKVQYQTNIKSLIKIRRIMFRQTLTIFSIFCLLVFSNTIHAQDKTVDQIIAVVGNNIILKSDIENRYMQNKAEGITTDGDMKCEILENFLVEKLLVAEAELDTTIEISDSQINESMDERIQYFIKNLGSEKAVEEYFKETMSKIKMDLSEVIRNQLFTSQMRNKIENKVTVTPAQVRYYYRNADPSDIPIVPTQVEYSEISIYPKIPIEKENSIKARLREMKKRIENGEDFATLAVLYSEGPSAPNGGELGYMGKGQLEPTYAEAAFNLREGKVSNVVKSDFGYHIIQLIDRKGDKVNTRHIILIPKPSQDALDKAKTALDSLANMIRINEITFEKAAIHFSADKSSRNGGGIAINPYTMSSKWKPEELDPTVSKVLNNLKPNEISDSFVSKNDKQRTVYKIVKLINKKKEHVANMQEDYQLLHDSYLQKMKEEAMNNWIAGKQSKTYIHIDDSYSNCNFKFKNWEKQ